MLAIKIWSPLNFTNNLQGRHFVVGGSNNFKLLSDIYLLYSFDSGFQKIVKFTAAIICLLLS